MHQTIMGDPNNGLDELEPNRSYLNDFPFLPYKMSQSQMCGANGQILRLKFEFFGGGPSHVDTTYISLGTGSENL